MSLETVAQLASISSPIISIIAIFSVYRVYKSQKKIDLEIDVKCDFSAWVVLVQKASDQDLFYSSIGEDLMVELDRIQTKTFLCGKWIEEVRNIIITFHDWATLVKTGVVSSEEQLRFRTKFFKSINQLRSKMREEEKYKFNMAKK